MATILAFVSAFGAAMQAIPALLKEIQGLRADITAAGLAKQEAQIQKDTNALQQGTTTTEQKDAAAKALAADTSKL